MWLMQGGGRCSWVSACVSAVYRYRCVQCVHGTDIECSQERKRGKIGEMDKISIIIPIKNEADKIEQCLEAVFNQTLNPLEVIVVDGHSTDKTVENARKFPVKVFYEDYHTRAGACQIGVENANGDFIAFTDADFVVLVPKD